MDIYKQINFQGTFEQAYENDENPIGTFDANILFYNNGEVFIENAQGLNETLIQKMKQESTPIPNVVVARGEDVSATINYLQVGENTDLNINYLEVGENTDLNINYLEGYKGEYKLTGKISDGRSFSAITDPSCIKDEKIYLKDICIGEASTLHGQTNNFVEAKYYLVGLPIYSKASADFFNQEEGLVITPITQKNQKKFSMMTLKNTQGLLAEEYDKYATWWNLILSFASGYDVQIIYEIKVFKGAVDEELVEVEYWSGRSPILHQRGFQVIEDISAFICEVASAVTDENFDQKGLGLALSWYKDSWTTDVAPAQFILLCTVLETLNYKYSSTSTEAKASNALLETKEFRIIRDKIFKLLQESEENFTDEKHKINYSIFRRKVENNFGDNNRIGSLRVSLQKMLKEYQVKYDDLFKNLEVIDIRDKVTHEGYASKVNNEDWIKIITLVVRIILSILKYKGYYWEHQEAEFKNPPEYNIYTRKHILFEQAVTEQTVPEQAVTEQVQEEGKSSQNID